MARTKFNQRSANRVDVPMGATGGRPPSKASIAVLAASILLAVWAAAMLTPFGRVGYYYFFVYAEFYLGVITLVSLSITIMVGLVATDRLVLSIRQRVLLQSAHRTTGIIAVTSLVAHIWTKTIEQHVRVIDVFVPFIAPYNTVYVGFGTLSGWIMMLVMWTGLARAKFIGRGKPWMWRAIHAVSYLMWPIALVHGLGAGRPAATWVVVSYVVCVLAVLVGLAVRLSVSLNRRKDFSSTATGALKPVGSLVPTQAPTAKKTKPARRPEPEPDRVGAETWVPAGAPRTSAAPVSAQPGPISGRPVSGAPMSAPISGMPVSGSPVSGSPYDAEPRGRRYAEEEERVPRRRRAADDDVAVPAPRRAATERYDEPTGLISRRALDVDRYADPVPPRGRRRADGDPGYGDPGYGDPGYGDPGYGDEPRGRRYADDDVPAPRARRAAEDDIPPRRRPAPEPPVDHDGAAPRRRRYAGADEAPDRPRGRRYAADDDYDDAPPRRRPDVRTTGEFTVDADRWRDDAPPLPRQNRSRYADDDTPRARRDRGAGADSGRHSRTEFVDLAAPADPWGAAGDADRMEFDETPTLVDIASRRARKQAQQDTGRPAGRGARGRGRAGEDGLDDAQYWRQLRGEAQ